MLAITSQVGCNYLFIIYLFIINFTIKIMLSIINLFDYFWVMSND
jgi:hypothetical protein